MRCTPVGRSNLGADATVDLYRFGTTKELEDSLQAKKEEIGATFGEDPAKPPALTGWHWERTADTTEGQVMAWKEGELSHLVWTLEDERIWAAVSVTKGDPAAIWAWWQDPQG